MKEAEYEEEACKINDWLRLKGIRRIGYTEEVTYNRFCGLADGMLGKREETLLSLTLELNFLPEGIIE
ncbi:hypothetical protein [Bacillus sp. FJAT-29814]|uniref:hypothetical protein n=1 Tax=Bacillus sp. FJAT-29814 TaxID=1729688 RepID=UPI00083399A0|nr:hypothetical protein [Bacillus sp. FJAT-29814]